MADLSSLSQVKAVKMLLLGNSGIGKSGSLASLARAGYNLRIIDFDNGLQYLASELSDSPEALARVKYKTFTDNFRGQGANILPVGVPQAFAKAMEALNNWKEDDGTSLGGVSKWTLQDVLVIDSLTLMSRAVMNHVLAVNGRSGQNPSQPNWGEAMRIVEDFIAMLYGDNIPCHVVVISHIVQLGDEETGFQGFPSTLGNKLPPKVPRFFNTMVEAFVQGTGANAKRKIRTRSRPGLDLKVASKNVPPELPLETGLADLFSAMRG